MRWIDSLTYLLIFTEFHFFLQELKQKKEEESLEVELSIPISYWIDHRPIAQAQAEVPSRSYPVCQLQSS